MTAAMTASTTPIKAVRLESGIAPPFSEIRKLGYTAGNAGGVETNPVSGEPPSILQSWLATAILDPSRLSPVSGGA
jgi:hypothetical protein